MNGQPEEAGSADRKAALNEATRLASSSQLADQEALFGKLTSKEFLSVLDSGEDYQMPAQQLRVAKPLQTLAENNAPAARSNLVRLARDPQFAASRSRVHLLVLALVEVRPSPPEAVSFWRDHARPEAVLRHVTVNAIADNGSEPALNLLLEILEDERHSNRERVLWFRDPVLRHRVEPGVLRMCERLINGRLDESLRVSLIEALSDYRPEEWYLECEPPKPGLWLIAPEESKQLARGLFTRAMQSLKLDERQKAAVRRTLKELGDRGDEPKP